MSDTSRRGGASQLPCQPLPHQIEAIEFMQRNKQCILADEMGVGKTGAAILAAELPCIVICLCTLKQTWAREIERFRPGSHVQILNGRTPTPIEPRADFVILNPDIAGAHAATIKPGRFSTCIIDECHRVSNRKTTRFEAVKNLAWPCRFRFLLSGTPIVNRPYELVGLLHLLGRLNSDFGGWEEFCDTYCNRYWADHGNGTGHWDVTGARNLDLLYARLTQRGIMLRRTKADVLPDLPKKSRAIVPVELRPEDLSRYMKAEHELTAQLREKAIDLDSVEFEGLAGVRHAVGLAKLPAVIEHIRTALDTPGKLIVFAHHVDVRAEVVAAFPGIALAIEQKTRNRQGVVDRFQNDAAVRILVTSPQLGGVGLTATAAHRVVFAELDWTPAAMTQGEDRAHRLGQTRDVHVEYLIAPETVDAHMLGILARKTEIFSEAIEGGLVDTGWLDRLYSGAGVIRKPRRGVAERDRRAELMREWRDLNRRGDIVVWGKPIRARWSLEGKLVPIAN